MRNACNFGDRDGDAASFVSFMVVSMVEEACCLSGVASDASSSSSSGGRETCRKGEGMTGDVDLKAVAGGIRPLEEFPDRAAKGAGRCLFARRDVWAPVLEALSSTSSTELGCKWVALGGLKDVEPNRLESPSSISASSRILTDRKSTRLNSSHQIISYAVFCLKK